MSTDRPRKASAPWRWRWGADDRRVHEDVEALEAAGLLSRDEGGLRADYDAFDVSMRVALERTSDMRYPIAIEPRTNTSDYGVVVPDLPGCFSAGETLEEAIAGAEEAGLAWIDAALEAGDPSPPPSPLEAIRVNPDYAGWILSVVTIDTGALDRAGSI